MWGMIKKAIAGCYFYLKEFSIVLWHGYTLEGEAGTKALSIGYHAWQRGDVKAAVREGTSDLVNYVNKHRVRSAAIGAVFLARYTSPIGLMPTTKLLYKRLSSLCQKTIETGVDESVAAQFKLVYERTLRAFDAVNKKYMQPLSLQGTIEDKEFRKKMIEWAGKLKKRLSVAWQDEKWLMDYICNQYPQSWIDCFKKTMETKNINFKSCIAAFELLEDSPSNTMLAHALTEFQKCKDSLSKLIEMMAENMDLFRVEFLQESAKQVANATPDRVLAALEKLSHHFPSKTQLIGFSIFVSSMKRLHRNNAAAPLEQPEVRPLLPN